MDFARQPLFAMLSQRLGWLTERQKVLAENIANVDTPNFKPHDLKKLSFDEMVRGASSLMSMSRTSSKHLDSGALRGTDAAGRPVKEKPFETTLSGNSVTLDVELMKVSESAQDHALATNLYKQQINLFRTVIGR